MGEYDFPIDSEEERIERDHLLVGEEIDWNEIQGGIVSFGWADTDNYGPVDFDDARVAMENGLIPVDEIIGKPNQDELIIFANNVISNNLYDKEYSIEFGGYITTTDTELRPDANNVWFDSMIIRGGVPVDTLYTIQNKFPRPSETEYDENKLYVWWD